LRIRIKEMAFLKRTELVTKKIYGRDTRELTGSQKLHLQFTGPGNETLINEGPPAGKKWSVVTVVEVKELDA
jgi:hypothetical protein